MSLKKLRWSKVYESSEEELIDLLENMSINATKQILDPDETKIIDLNSPESAIWCAEGSFEIMSENQNLSMQPGDYVKATEPVQNAQIISGFTGCTYYIS